MPGGSFFSEAEAILRDSAQSVLHKFLSVHQDGKWHPNGFAVFHLEDPEGLGRLRFHVWPRGLRISLEGQPAIHSHPWDLCSLVIAGCYTDTLYQVRECDRESQGRLRGFVVRRGGEHEGDLVCPTLSWYEVIGKEHRAIPEGSIHRVPLGVLHESHIPLNKCVATLLIASKTTDFSKVLLVGNSSFGERRYLRPQVSTEELNRIRLDLAATLRA